MSAQTPDSFDPSASQDGVKREPSGDLRATIKTGPAVVREFSPAVRAELEALCARYPTRESALLPALRMLEREFGVVDNEGMRHVAKILGVSPAKVFGVATFYTHYRRENDGQYVFQVCSTLPCALRGSERVYDYLSEKLQLAQNETSPDRKFTLKKVECLANCDRAPCMQVNEDFVDCLTEQDVDKYLAELRELPPPKIEAGNVVKMGPWHPPPQVYHLPPNPHAPNLLAHVLEPDSFTIGNYMGRGGYKVAEDMYKSGRNPDEVVETVFQSGLRGRGGAGFPTGQKWKFLAKNNKPRYLVVNADESEPGTFKDKMLMDRDPHGLVEGILIAAYAINSQDAYIYIRGELPEGARTLNKAIAEAYEKGFLGKDVFGTGRRVDITVHRGAGAYICGEETGLLSSLEGKRGNPKIKPPFPAVEGAWGCPTIVNNVETLMCLPGILRNGPQWFRQWGTEKSPGTKIFSVSGHIVRPGNYELPLGVPMKEFLFDVCGGIPNGKKLKAVIPGGSSAPVFTADEILNGYTTKEGERKPILMDFDTIAAAGSMLGSGAIIVMDEDTCMVESIWNLLRFYHHESCGQCTPCREGTGWIEKLSGRFERGGGRLSEIDEIDDVAWSMVGRTICVLADAAAMPARSFVRKFHADFEAHVKHGGCPHKHGHAPKLGKRSTGHH